MPGVVGLRNFFIFTLVILCDTMVELRLKVGPKGQVVIPKLIRERYGISVNDYVIVELREDGILLRGRPSRKKLLENLVRHREYVKRLGVNARLGDLKGEFLELEFEED